MASVGHVVVGLALGRALFAGRDAPARARAVGTALLAALALLPDADVVAFRLGIPYGAAWGHRGASHSLAVALLAALPLALAGAPLGVPRLRLYVFATLAVASHGPLDLLTDGGLGAAYAWPFSDARLFFPVQPLPVAPIGARMLGRRGLYVVAVELLAFAPLLLYALWPRGLARARGRDAA